jgi:hypothetical protein
MGARGGNRNQRRRPAAAMLGQLLTEAEAELAYIFGAPAWHRRGHVAPRREAALTPHMDTRLWSAMASGWCPVLFGQDLSRCAQRERADAEQLLRDRREADGRGNLDRFAA